ncbi:EAL domain-containing protein [Sulfurimonas sp.]|uniref:EAL domain-containing protein n=1 Tax=Sulfurimonas sp. TaxID=2022749 RepID=UPI002B4A2B2E|nr:EAL domain-containing protein [Sulfurimonas sp.]
MKNTFFDFKILFLFLVPLISILYLSLSFISIKYNNLNESTTHKFSAYATNIFTNLIHDLQKERGLSSGYIAFPDKNSKNKLLSQHKQTDKSYKKLLSLIKLISDKEELLQKEIRDKNDPLVKKNILYLNELKNVRKKILDNSFKFDEQFKYYSKLNEKLMQSIEVLTMVINKYSNDNNALYEIQLLKEDAGRERAIIYNQLNSNKFEYMLQIKFLQSQQKHEHEEFMLNASTSSIFIYNSILTKQNEEELNILRKSFLSKSLDSNDAKKWFKVTTFRIDMLEKISTKILSKYTSQSEDLYSNALFTLFIVILLWLLSIISLVSLATILIKKIQKENENIADLKMFAHTFNSHQAITITDANGIIIKVNDAFTRITGYSASEVIGKNPRILKSMKHEENFYKKMWTDLISKGEWNDDIYNKRKNSEIYLERLSITAIKDNNNITTHYLAQFIDVTDIKEAQEKAQHQADHDFLTGLVNRKYLLQRLNEELVKAIRHNFLHAFLFIDLDAFKNINDTYGHDIGDKLLIEVSKRLKSILREEDIVARISGDEFAVVILNIDKETPEAAKDVKEICTKIINKLNKTFIFNEQKLNISASIGVKLFPDDKVGIPEIMTNADAAMYQAKSQGKNQFVFFNKTIELELKRLQLLEEELIFAYNNDGFKFYYQAKVDIKTGNIIGAEALIRWQHPKRGLLYPDSFLKVLTDMGMIHDISILALSSACKFIKSYKKIFNGIISININVNELLDPLFEQDIISTVNSFGVNPANIELEITEKELIKDISAAVLKIESLRKVGFKFAIDDFGIGCSSISYLKQLPVNSLKIDKSFLTNLNNSSNKEVIKMLIHMADTFNMQSVIEGVEDKEQLLFIQDSGAKQYQGYYFSKAIDEENFVKLINKTTNLSSLYNNKTVWSN